MGMSDYLKTIRSKVGHTLLQLPSVTVANFDNNGRLLLIKHRDTNKWVLPGGTIEPLEIPAEAAVREMWEETGLFVKLAKIIGVYGGSEFTVNYSNGDKVSYVMTVFEGQTTGGVLKTSNEESMEARYFLHEEITYLDTQPWVAAILTDVFKLQTQAFFKSSSLRAEDLLNKNL
jgi:8-oxo-dGTP pyrophosphatase MutT (NUDIX family)